jgi:hypothetical protein
LTYAAFTPTAYAVLYDVMVLAVAEPMIKNVDKTTMTIAYLSPIVSQEEFVSHLSF